MTKEQYLLFKEDLKKAIEVTKLNKKHRKAYWNDGFETKEAQEAAIIARGAKMREIEETMTNKIDDGYLTHLAYYCVKHQLTDDEIKTYVEQEVKKRKNIDEWSIDYAIKKYPEYIKNYFSLYEKIVCDNESVA